MKPGTMVVPRALKTRAPAGTRQSPTHAMRLPVTTSVPVRTWRRSSVTRRALVKATVPAGMSRGTRSVMAVVSARRVATSNAYARLPLP